LENIEKNIFDGLSPSVMEFINDLKLNHKEKYESLTREDVLWLKNHLEAVFNAQATTTSTTPDATTTSTTPVATTTTSTTPVATTTTSTTPVATTTTSTTPVATTTTSTTPVATTTTSTTPVATTTTSTTPVATTTTSTTPVATTTTSTTPNPLPPIPRGYKGYFAGGTTASTPTYTTTIDIVYYYNDSISASQYPLTTAKTGLAGLGDGYTYGYFAGGNTGAGVPTLTADIITFKTDVVASLSSANLSNVRSFLSSCSGNANQGYFLGGVSAASTIIGRVDIINYYTRTTSNLTNALARALYGGLSNRVDAGYAFGGTTTFPSYTPIVTAEKIDYTLSTVSTYATSNLGTATMGMLCSDGQAGSKGYIFGGGTGATPTYIATFQKLDYTTETWTSLTSSLSATFGGAGITEGETRGYVAGGTTNNSTTYVSSAYRIVFATDTIASNSQNLSLARTTLAGTASIDTPPPVIIGGLVGYWGGGTTGNPANTIYKIAFDTDVTTQLSSVISLARSYVSGVSGNAYYGYFCGGNSSSGTALTNKIDKLNYSTEACAAIAGTLTTAKCAAGGFGMVFGQGPTGGNRGYIAGGQTDASLNSTTATDRITYSTDVVSASSSLPAPVTRLCAGMNGGSDGRGFIAGGNSTPTTGYMSAIRSFSYATETFSTSASVLTVARSGPSGFCDNSQTGFWCGGYNGSYLTTVESFVFATDTVTAKSTAALTIATTDSSGIGGADTAGYTSGGQTGASAYTKTTYKIEYMTNYSRNVSTADIVTNTTGMGGIALTVAAPIQGSGIAFFNGGVNTTGTFVNTSDKLDFSTDVTAASTSSQIQSIGYWGSCPGGNAVGYFAGGSTSSAAAGITNVMGKISYYTSTGSTSGLPTIGTARSKIYGIWNGSAYSYWFGGQTAGTNLAFSTTTTKMTLSTLSTSSVSGMNNNAFYAAVTNYSNFGYVAGGMTNLVNPTGLIATRQKLTFASDTFSSATSVLSQARNALSGVSANKIKGYFMGGNTSTTSGSEVPSAVTDKVTYATDTFAAVGAANLTTARWASGAASDGSSVGYVLGGCTGSAASTAVANADKITAFNDITSAVATANLSTARFALAGVGQFVTNQQFLPLLGVG